MALTAALLEAVSRDHGPRVARAYRPGPTLALGRMDRRSPGFRRACETARAHGLTPLMRLGGGHAAAYGPGCLIIELIGPNARIADGLEARFLELASLFEVL